MRRSFALVEKRDIVGLVIIDWEIAVEYIASTTRNWKGMSLLGTREVVFIPITCVI